MRRYILLVSFVLASSAAAQDVPLGPRLGPTVDAYERGYYSLFPSVEGFVEAQLERDGGWVRATVAREEGDPLVVRISQEAAGTIREVVAVYESFEEATRLYELGAARATDLGSHMLPVGPRLALGRLAPRRFDVTLSTGEQIQFSVLRVEGDTAYVWTPERPFTLADLSEVRAVPIAGIERLESKLDAPHSAGRVLAGAAFATLGSGLAVGAGVPDDGREAVAASVLGLLQGGLVLAAGRSDPGLVLPERIDSPRRVAALFTRDQVIAQPAPEFRQALTDGQFQTMDLPPVKRGEGASPRPRRRSLFLMVSGTGRQALDSPTVTGSYASGFGTRLDLQSVALSGLRYQALAGRSLTERLSVGIEAGLVAREEGEGFQPAVTSASAVGFVEYDVISPDYFAPQPFSVSLAVGAGIGRQSVEMDIELPPPVAGGVPIEEVPTAYSAEEIGLAWLGRVSGRYHVNTRVAIQVSTSIRGLPAPAIGAVEFQNPRAGSQLVLFEWDEIRPPSRFAEVTVGTRVSL